jgi:hypothetical protein
MVLFAEIPKYLLVSVPICNVAVVEAYIPPTKVVPFLKLIVPAAPAVPPTSR